MDIKRKLAVSGVWSIVAAVFQNLSTMIVFVALARLLSPKEFGIVAYATVFVELSRTIVQGGIPDALVQRGEWDEELATTAFWANLFAGCLLSALLVALAGPLGGGSYDADGASFTLVMGALSLMLVIEGLSAVHLAKLRREFRFKAIAARRMITNVAGGAIGVALAWAGWGVWALVLSRLVTAATGSIMLWRATRFRPSLRFSFAHLRGIAAFSGNQLGVQLLGQANAQVAPLFIGAVLGPAAIAQYRIGSRALDLMVSMVIKPLQSAALTAFAHVHHRDGRIGQAYLRVTRACALLCLPVFFGAAAIAPDFVVFVFGPKWREGSYVMVALALFGGPATLGYFQAPALAAAGRAGLAFWATLTGFVGNALVAALTVGHGAVAVAAGFTARAYVTTPISLRFVSRGIGVPPTRAIANILPPLLCAALMGATVAFLRIRLLDGQPILARLLLCIGAGGLLYVLSLWLFARPFVRANVGELSPLLPQAVRRRLPQRS